MEIPVTTKLLIQLAMEKGEQGVYELMKKAYADGMKKGREQALNQIFTFHSEEGK